MENWKDRITINPSISHGRPCIKGIQASATVDPVLKGHEFGCLLLLIILLQGQAKMRF
ncbi:MAG: hypothetical protein H6Q41_1952 [Deltaproteobacteria bacterium]|nr:hypothetical protein [Deltaproteobacteria bacterium]